MRDPTCDRVCYNDIEGITEDDITASIVDGTGWRLEPPDRSVFHNEGVEPETNDKYTHSDGREAIFTTNESGDRVPVTDHN